MGVESGAYWGLILGLAGFFPERGGPCEREARRPGITVPAGSWFGLF